jgi:hypothetical protein
MAVEKPKITFVVHSPLYVRNYFRTDALSDLERRFDVHFVVSDQVGDLGPVMQSGRKVTVYESDLENMKAQYKTYKVLMWRFRKRSSTFQFRLDRIFNPKRPYHPFTIGNFRANLSAWAERVGIGYRKARLAVMAWGPIFSRLKRRRIDNLVPAEGLARAVAAAGGDLIVAPSSAFDPECNDLIKLAEASGTRTLFLIDNWDNLSSKSVMYLKPDHLGVWGEQSAQHAIRIQDFDPAQITLIGTPRFDEYFTARTRDDLPSPFDHPYILFIGTSLAFDEVAALKHLDAVIDRNADVFGQARIVYRPHPWRESEDTIEGSGLRHVLLDPQMAERHLKRRKGYDFQPDLSWYPRILKNADVVVGGLTSMLIEATIFWKDFVALTYDDGQNITNQRTVLERSEHFRGLERVPSVAFCKEQADAERLLIDAWKRRGSRDRDGIDAARRWLLFDDDRPYRQRLADLVAEQVRTSRAG